MNDEYLLKITGDILEMERENIANDYNLDGKEMSRRIIKIIERSVDKYENQ